LPVVTAAALREQRDGFLAKMKNVFSSVMGEQTNIFKNGGSFLLKCLDNEVDLVMHGHQHRSWFSTIEYPATAEVPRRLLVAGAASAGKATYGSYRYCVYNLDASGNVKVTERTTSKDLPRYSQHASFRLYDYGEMRSRRCQKLAGLLDGVKIEDLDTEYGIAQADELVRFTRIDADGNALMTRTYKNLRPRGRQTLDTLPVSTVSQMAFVGVAPPQVRILHDPHKYYEPPRWEVVPSPDGAGAKGGSVGRIRFRPPLHADHPLSLKVREGISTGRRDPVGQPRACGEPRSRLVSARCDRGDSLSARPRSNATADRSRVEGQRGRSGGRG
jgi:hypothetical protein